MQIFASVVVLAKAYAQLNVLASQMMENAKLMLLAVSAVAHVKLNVQLKQSKMQNNYQKTNKNHLITNVI